MSQTEIVQTATVEATRLIDSAHAEADRLRGECDIYVDSKLADFEDFLNGTLRSVGRGRHQLRTAAGTARLRGTVGPRRLAVRSTFMATHAEDGGGAAPHGRRS